MNTKQTFTIYNASAGSGKTYTLVKEYLKILFCSKNKEQFKRILAITFTNKAVAEMKTRIIDTLKAFSSTSILTSKDSMFKSICDELDIEPKTLHKKSKTLLHTIIHNYAAFDISTIDGFTHKLIRTFAYDLKLPLNFEVELDQDSLLHEAVDSLIAKAGTNKAITKTLVDFAIEKADDDKSWDVSFDFNKIAKLLVNENDLPFIEGLKDKTFDDFKTIKAQLKQGIKASKNTVVETALNVLKQIENNHLEFSDFSRSTLPNHFKKASELNIDGLYNNNLETNISTNKGIYPIKLESSKANVIDTMLPEIEISYQLIKHTVFHLKFLKAFYKNVTPLSVLNAINKELTELKQEQNKMLISEFNTIISKEIKNQPTPFIYERIGEKFKHYFIDEFQDTSVNQWGNLFPLLDNALSTEDGNTMLVGDAKQAIYRWRGGKAEQFIDLFTKQSIPFQIEQDVRTLKDNYRSFKEIVSFNNNFFNFLAISFFNNEHYKALYEQAHQNITKENDGYVELSFLEIDKDDDRDQLFSKQVYLHINTCLKYGYELQDICILVRKKKEGIAVANYLSTHDIPIISSDTLLINNSQDVVFVNNVLALLIQPKDNEIKIKILNHLVSLLNIEDKHEFFTTHINVSVSDLFKSLETYNIYISSKNILQLPLYDMAETIVRSFNLIETSNAYIQFYLDIVLDFSQKKGSDISGFINYFDKKKENLSIISPSGLNAVQVMTIHKSKGLEFPIVIFPYADLDIYRELEPKEWFAVEKEKYAGFSYALLNYNKDFEYFGNEGKTIYNRHKSEQELDNINLLYVTLTRAVEQLYIVSTKDITTKGVVNSKKYSGLFISYLKHLGLWEDSKLIYSFGNQNKCSEPSIHSKKAEIQQEFISTAKEKHNINMVTKSGYLWDTNQQKAIEKGNLVHDIMSQIKTKEDIPFTITDFINSGTINAEQAVTLKQIILQIVEHPNLIDYFSSHYTVYNERDIITKSGIILRPDRVVINNNEAIIIDYKTGLADKKHEQQLQLYQDILVGMSIKVKKKLLVYINDDIVVKDA